METLLRLSGLLSDDDSGATDLQTLEKRLTEKNARASKEKENGAASSHSASPAPDRESQSPATDVAHGETAQFREDATPQPNGAESHNLTGAGASDSASTKNKSPTKKSSVKGEEHEVEALSEAMCSLITNNSGETRYIGKTSLLVLTSLSNFFFRVVIRFLNLLPQRYSVGQRKDWRHFFPRNDLDHFNRGQ